MSDDKLRGGDGVGRPPKAGDGAGAQPAPVDDSATVPVPLALTPSGELEPDTMTRGDTPAPLPPSPASAAAEVWLEDAVTRPSALPDIASSQPGGAPSNGSGTQAAAELDPLAALREAHAQAARAGRRLLILATVTAFVVGLAAGVFLRACT